ncbi:hypothetical protein U0355_12145 [Salimicrobium sp. PL1-032A]|uniref:hypothetical protein n=1 Tax=Salimicrobium sp. PL1-032A TaxID=3095364 RepID=UPI0032610F6D
MSYQPAKDKGPDRSLGILKDGYTFAQKRLQRQHLDVYETKILGEKAALLGGEKGAELFYDKDKMKRGGAMPAFHPENSLRGERCPDDGWESVRTP